jgi:hypothetical protein
LSSYIQRNYFRFDYIWNQKLLNFDTDAYALSIAYILTAFIGLAFWEIGVPVVPSNSILFEWDDNFEEDHDTGGSTLIILYSILIGAMVAGAQVPEEEDERVADELCDVRPTTAGPTAARPSELQRAVSGSADTVNPISGSVHGSFELDAGQPSLATVSAATAGGPHPSLCEALLGKETLVTYIALWNEFLG